MPVLLPSRNRILLSAELNCQSSGCRLAIQKKLLPSLFELSEGALHFLHDVARIGAILYGMATASVIVLRFRRPDMPRPYRTIGYPFVPIAFVLGIGCLIVSTLRSSPRESILGLLLISLGLPFYFYWKRRA